MSQYDIELRPVPPRRHMKNTIEPKHGSIRSIFLSLKAADEKVSDSVLAIRAIRISDDLYGSDTLSSFEMAKCFSKPLIVNQLSIPVDEILQSAHDELIAKRKLTLVMRSKTYCSNSFKVGDLIQVSIKDGKTKRGKWLSPRQIMEINSEAGTVTVPGRSGKHVCAAVEDVRAARHENEWSTAIQDSIDELNSNLITMVENQKSSSDNDDDRHNEPHGDFIYGNIDGNIEVESVVGSRIVVYWPLEHPYFNGTVGTITTKNGRHNVIYDDDGFASLELMKEDWKYINSNDTVHASQSGFKTFLRSNEPEVLKHTFETLGNKSFMKPKSQEFDQAPLVNAYKDEEDKVLQNVKTVSLSMVSNLANVIGSHTIYKLKFHEYQSLKIKARISPHGNEDSDKENLRTDCCMCPLLGIRIIAITASMRKLRIVRIDAKGAFLQTGPAQRDVYVKPPRESKYRNVLWLRETAAYVLINFNAKWKNQSDELFIKLGLQQVELIPQLFVMFSQNGELSVLAIKIVDDILRTGTDDDMRHFISKLNATFELGEIVNGPGTLRCYGINIIQDTNHTVSIHANENLFAIYPYLISRIPRHQCDERMHEVELKDFMSINASIGWLGITESPRCSFYAIHLQQKIGIYSVSAIVNQFNASIILKKYCTSTKYNSPNSTDISKINLVAFADASHTTESSQLCYIVGLMYGTVKKGNQFQLLSWASQKSRRPAKSTPAAEILAASEAVDEIVMIKNVLTKLFHVSIKTMVIVYSKDLYYALSSKNNTIDKSVRPDVNTMRFYFETVVDVFAWIAGSLNRADVGTKLDSPLTADPILSLATGILQTDLSGCEMSSRDKCFE